ncbi:hypothetical protein [Nocardioides convexus]|uniref:hypothetical protein n=1 Tax=Nocardioides convexus TaxID=2712224 RepID=UPI0024186F32|nr:hypothetical protein [Nocardioides convexus]
MGRLASISAAASAVLARASLAGQAEVAIALHRASYVGQGVAAEPLQVGQARPGSGRGRRRSAARPDSALIVMTVSE